MHGANLKASAFWGGGEMDRKLCKDFNCICIILFL